MAAVKCNNCGCDCHCSLQEHSDMYGVCSCTACSCDKGLVQDDTGECETCQQIQKNAVVCTQKKKKTTENVVSKKIKKKQKH